MKVGIILYSYSGNSLSVGERLKTALLAKGQDASGPSWKEDFMLCYGAFYESMDGWKSCHSSDETSDSS